jgi:exonuclease SbcD
MKIIHFADLHLGVETYGKIDPATGLSSRLSDFLASLDTLVDYALENKVDLVLFCGDAYKSRDPNQTQQRELARRINRLSATGIPVLLLVGNHDLPNAIGRATATEIFDTLAVENVHVSGKPGIYKVPTPSGVIQIATLPWLRRSALLANLNREDANSLSFDELNRELEKVLTDIISGHARQLEPGLPTILAAHVWVSGARLGTERYITIGQEHTLLPGSVALPVFDYIALGHIHRHQVLQQEPPVVYSGSLSALDFGEEGDEKGFYLVDIEPDGETGGRRVSFEFHPVAGRRFLTLGADIAADDTDPTATVLAAIASQGEKIRGAIVRLLIRLPAVVEGQLNDSDIRAALAEAHYFAIAREISQETRPRLGGHTAEDITPVEALKAYLASKKYSQKQSAKLLKTGRELIQELSKEQG